MTLNELIVDLTPRLHGWAEIPKALTLAHYVLALRPKVIVEIGTWGGRSAFPMILACKQIGIGKVTCIDPWNSEASADGQVTEVDKRWWGSMVNHQIVYEDFLRHVQSLQIEQFVEVHRIKSDDYEPPKAIDILHLDGNHGPQAVKDAERYAPFVRAGGVCILDDLNWAGGYVKRAAEFLVTIGFLELHPLGTGAVYLRL